MQEFIVFQSVCEFFLWSPIWSNFSFHCSSLCFTICFVISLFSCGISGSMGFVLRSMFLSFIAFLMSSGRDWLNFFILPLGMWCLSATSMKLVRSLFAKCTLPEVGTF